jgi:hypothetical protein
MGRAAVCRDAGEVQVNQWDCAGDRHGAGLALGLGWRRTGVLKLSTLLAKSTVVLMPGAASPPLLPMLLAKGMYFNGLAQMPALLAVGPAVGKRVGPCPGGGGFGVWARRRSGDRAANGEAPSASDAALRVRIPRALACDSHGLAREGWARAAPGQATVTRMGRAPSVARLQELWRTKCQPAAARSRARSAGWQAGR